MHAYFAGAIFDGHIEHWKPGLGDIQVCGDRPLPVDIGEHVTGAAAHPQYILAARWLCAAAARAGAPPLGEEVSV